MDKLARLKQLVLAAIRGKRAAYQATFLNSPTGRIVLEDLARLCRAHESTYHPEHSQRLDGRREVWLHIQQYLRLSDEDLWKLFKPRNVE